MCNCIPVVALNLALWPVTCRPFGCFPVVISHELNGEKRYVILAHGDVSFAKIASSLPRYVKAEREKDSVSLQGEKFLIFLFLE